MCVRSLARESPRINQIGLLVAWCARVSKEYNIINPESGGRWREQLLRAFSVVNLPLLLNAHFKILMGAPGASLSPLMLPKCRHFWLASKQISSLAQPAWNHYHVAGKRKMNEPNRNNGEGATQKAASVSRLI